MCNSRLSGVRPRWSGACCLVRRLLCSVHCSLLVVSVLKFLRPYFRLSSHWLCIYARVVFCLGFVWFTLSAHVCTGIRVCVLCCCCMVNVLYMSIVQKTFGLLTSALVVCLWGFIHYVGSLVHCVFVRVRVMGVESVFLYVLSISLFNCIQSPRICTVCDCVSLSAPVCTLCMCVFLCPCVSVCVCDRGRCVFVWCWSVFECNRSSDFSTVCVSLGICVCSLSLSHVVCFVCVCARARARVRGWMVCGRGSRGDRDDG